MQDLTEELQNARESAKEAKSQERSLKEEVCRLTSELQISKKTHKRLQADREEREKEIQELKQQNSRFKGALQVRGAIKSKEACSIDEQVDLNRYWPWRFLYV